MSLFVALLFVVLTPGVLVTLPKKGSKLMVAATHGLIFAVIYSLTHKMVWNLFYAEGFAPKKVVTVPKPAPRPVPRPVPKPKKR